MRLRDLRYLVRFQNVFETAAEQFMGIYLRLAVHLAFPIIMHIINECGLRCGSRQMSCRDWAASGPGSRAFTDCPNECASVSSVLWFSTCGLSLHRTAFEYCDPLRPGRN